MPFPLAEEHTFAFPRAQEAHVSGTNSGVPRVGFGMAPNLAAVMVSPVLDGPVTEGMRVEALL